jgi:hypothetical protein
MIPAKIKLIPLYLSQDKYNYQIILDKETKTFPVMIPEPYVDFLQLLKHHMDLYIESESPIHKIKLTDATITDSIEIYYILFLPFDTKLKHTSITTDILDIYEHIPQNAQQIISLL